MKYFIRTIVVLAFLFVLYMLVGQDLNLNFRLMPPPRPATIGKTLAEQLEEEKRAKAEESKNTVQPDAPKSKPKRDWVDIATSRTLKVLVMPHTDMIGLARRMEPEDFERGLTAAFAEKYDLDVQLIEIERFDDLLDALNRGEGDIVAACLTDTPARREKVNFSDPYVRIKEQVVASASLKDVNSVSQVDGLRGIIQYATAHTENMRKLQNAYHGLKATYAESYFEPDELFRMVGNGTYDFTINDSNYIESYLAYRNDIKIIHTFPETRNIAWAVRKNSPALLTKLNDFLGSYLPESRYEVKKGDISEIRERKYLRVLTRNIPYCYFIHRGHQMGFEFELISKFAKEQGMNAVMIVPPEWGDLTDWLKEGKGDIIASNFTMNAQRAADIEKDGLTFCAPYGKVSQVIVGRTTEKPMRSINDLNGKTVIVRKNSSYWRTLESIRAKGIKINILAAPDDMETHELMEKVASCEFPLTVGDDVIVNMVTANDVPVKKLLQISPEEPYSWVVRKEDRKLREAVLDFFQREGKSAFFNITYKKYYDYSADKKPVKEFIRRDSTEFSPYDDIFRKYGQKFGLEWCLIASQAYQESRFDPQAKSYLGTLGLMQLLPSTAREMGFRDVVEPDNGVHAGTKYLTLQKGRFPEKVDEYNKLCFALASYNAGYGHVYDARKLAAEMNLSPDIWFGNVEEALKRLSNPKYASKARYGYCRSSETVNYVKDIMLRFRHYSDQVSAEEKRKKDQ